MVLFLAVLNRLSDAFCITLLTGVNNATEAPNSTTPAAIALACE